MHIKFTRTQRGVSSLSRGSEKLHRGSGSKTLEVRVFNYMIRKREGSPDKEILETNKGLESEPQSTLLVLQVVLKV